MRRKQQEVKLKATRDENTEKRYTRLMCELQEAHIRKKKEKEERKTG